MTAILCIILFFQSENGWLDAAVVLHAALFCGGEIVHYYGGASLRDWRKYLQTLCAETYKFSAAEVNTL